MSKTKLTLKQRKFVNEYIKNNGNAVKAALAAYDTDYNSAGAIAHDNIRKPVVIAEIDRILSEQGLNSDEWLGQKLKEGIDKGMEGKAKLADAVKIMDMLLKVKNTYPNNVKKSMQLNVKGNLATKDISLLIEQLEQLQATNASLIKELKSD